MHCISGLDIAFVFLAFELCIALVSCAYCILMGFAFLVVHCTCLHLFAFQLCIAFVCIGDLGIVFIAFFALELFTALVSWTREE